MPLNETDRQVLRHLIDNDSATGLTGLQIQQALNMKSGTIGSRLSRLEKNGLVEHRAQDEAPWPISGREAPVEPSQGVPRKFYYRAQPHARAGLAEAQAQSSPSQPHGWGKVPLPASI